jgi:uncharacterized 2Fe-2S/4Fe-4S cluster protein (DUF4445 family)
LARWITYIETAVDPDFQNEFVAAIHIPHAGDAFPHISDRLPHASATQRERASGRGGRARCRDRAAETPAT